MNERDYQDWLESQYSADEIAERDAYEAQAYDNFLQEQETNSPFTQEA